MQKPSDLKPTSRIKGERNRTVFLLLGFFAFIGWVYVFLMSDFFLIRDMEISGLRTLQPQDVKRVAFDLIDSAPMKFGFLPRRHALFLDRARLEEMIKIQLFAENVTVDKKDKRILRLIVEERSHRLVFHSHQQYLWVDLQGYVTGELNDNERKQMHARLLGQRLPRADEPPVIHRDLDELITTGYQVSESNFIKSWIQTASEIVKQGVLYREYEPPAHGTSTLASFKSIMGHDVLIDINDPLEIPLKTYLTYLKSPQTKNKVSEYVDIRIPGKLFIK